MSTVSVEVANTPDCPNVILYRVATWSHESKCNPLTPSISSDAGIELVSHALPSIEITLDAINSGVKREVRTVTMTATNAANVSVAV